MGDMTWRKASYSGNNNNCVEVAFDDGRVMIRDSKYLRAGLDPEAQPIISVTVAQWRDFLDVVAGRSTDSSEPAIAVRADGSATLISSGGVCLDYTPTEWLYFASAVTEGEFDDLANEWKTPADQLTGV
ncbi:DUF397 domain-containing protein [Nocardia vermiculata]|uniref:DUF397 domain-containing protein n=1 Tax=Nocardia vermiculata TaxID=257274 RepID=A0A846Y7V2_9NOCA|nr:DUF397 domain-containing protein [Nocardia vermiculata]NKY53942.1 DUF397 domain-containing protein [Nocardia vermiculata]